MSELLYFGGGGAVLISPAMSHCDYQHLVTIMFYILYIKCNILCNVLICSFTLIFIMVRTG